MTTWRNFEIDGSFTPLDVTAENWSATGYEEAVVRDLELIAATRSGSILLGFLVTPVLIIPYDHRWRDTNAVFDPLGLDGAVALGVGRRGPGLPDVLVRFTPGMFPPAGTPAIRTRAGVHPFHSDQALFHELFHAQEGAWGTTHDGYIGMPGGDMVRESEHRAVRVANIYHSETLRPLRASYPDVGSFTSAAEDYASGGLRALERRYEHYHIPLGFRGLRRVPRVPGDGRHDSYVVLENFLMDRLVRDSPTLTWVLERLPQSVCEYNPLREFASQTYDFVYLPEPWFFGESHTIDRSPVQEV